VRLSTRLQHIERGLDGVLRVCLHDGSVLDADTVLYATGESRTPAGLGLEERGVELGPRGEVIVDAQYRSSVRPSSPWAT